VDLAEGQLRNTNHCTSLTPYCLWAGLWLCVVICSHVTVVGVMCCGGGWCLVTNLERAPSTKRQRDMSSWSSAGMLGVYMAAEGRHTMQVINRKRALTRCYSETSACLPAHVPIGTGTLMLFLPFLLHFYLPSLHVYSFYYCFSRSSVHHSLAVWCVFLCSYLITCISFSTD
jgi:hypothetical protein